MSKKVVIFDIDDCLMPWAEKVHQACVAAGLTTLETWTRWGMYEDYGITKEAWLEVVDSLVVPGGIYHAPPYPGHAEAVQRVVDAGHEVHLVTARGFSDHAEQIREWTIEWVQEFKVPGTLWFSRNKDYTALLINATHAVDDGVHNAWALRKVGVEVYLRTQPHNVNEPWPWRVKDVPEFVERILSD